MENLHSTGPSGSQSGGPAADGEDEDFGSLLRQSRQRAARKNWDETPITVQMLDDPENGQFWRLMESARKRVRDHLHKETKNM